MNNEERLYYHNLKQCYECNDSKYKDCVRYEPMDPENNNDECLMYRTVMNDVVKITNPNNTVNPVFEGLEKIIKESNDEKSKNNR